MKTFQTDLGGGDVMSLKSQFFNTPAKALNLFVDF